MSETDKDFKYNPVINKRLKITAIIMAVVLGIAIVFLGIQLYLQSDSTSNSFSSGVITGKNTDMIDFSGEEIPNTNENQKALGQKSEIIEPASFIFWNGKDSADRKEMHIYIDFSEQRGRDAFISNYNTLTNYIENGQIELHVHSLLGGKSFSFYSSEALAEIFSTQPEKAWDSLFIMLRESPALSSYDNNEQLIDSISNVLNKNGVDQVDSESISNGTFASWLFTTKNDEQLQTGQRLPLIIIDGKQLNVEDTQDLNDVSVFKQSIDELLSQ